MKFISTTLLPVTRCYMCTVAVVINGKNSQRNVKNGQEKLKLVWKEFGHACSSNKLHDGFTHHSTVTHCPAVCSFHTHKITGNCFVEFTGYFVTRHDVCWCPKEV